MNTKPYEFLEFPKMLYHAAKAPITVGDAAAEEAKLAEGWADTKAKAEEIATAAKAVADQAAVDAAAVVVETAAKKPAKQAKS